MDKFDGTLAFLCDRKDDIGAPQLVSECTDLCLTMLTLRSSNERTNVS